MKRRWVRIGLLLALAFAIGVLAELRAKLPVAAPRLPPLPGTPTDAELRSRFERQHPGERPLNWAIAEAAAAFCDSQPMGRFQLAVKLGQWGNDCSDFVACAIDEGLGAKARFHRNSDQHLLGDDRRLFESFWLHPGDAAQPGDVLSIRHSPWYQPYDGACWHCGVIGPDGQVYDFTKLKSWSKARYGRNSVAWFTRHSRGKHQILVERLRAEYRYRAKPLPTP